MADHTHTVTTAPLKLASLQVMLDCEKRVADKDKIGVSAGAGCGNDHSLCLRIANGAAEEEDAQYSIRQVAGSTGINLCLRDFTRGWFAGIGLDWIGLDSSRFTPSSESDSGETDTAASFSNIRVGPTLGYKVASQGGFTFSMELGRGDSTVMGDTAGSISPAICEPGMRGMGSRNMGWSL